MKTNVRLPYRTAALSMFLFVAFFGMTYAVLGASLGWPALLDQPADVVLPLINQNHSATILGYYSFIITSMLLIPCASLLRRVINDPNSHWLEIAGGFAIAATVTRVLALFRWMFLIPGLADSYLAPGATSASRETITLIYRSFNLYTDGFGTHLGDQLFTGLWIGFASIVLLRSRGAYRWSGVAGIVVMLAQILTCITDFNAQPNPLLVVTQSLVYIWVATLGVVLLFRRPVFSETSAANT